MALVKGWFRNADQDKDVVQCHFNPNEISISRSNTWSADKSSGSGVANVNFGGMGPLTLQVTVIFDTYFPDNTNVKDVREAATDKLMSLMGASVNTPSKTGKTPRPPHVQFSWGLFQSFHGVITQMSVKFTLFTPEGMPVRATVQVAMQEVPPEGPRTAKKGQNPTSQAAGARRVHVVQDGDTIDWIAATELGDPTVWRIIADANGIEDPRRLRLGQRLIIPEDV